MLFSFVFLRVIEVQLFFIFPPFGLALHLFRVASQSSVSGSRKLSSALIEQNEKPTGAFFCQRAVFSFLNRDFVGFFVLKWFVFEAAVKQGKVYNVLVPSVHNLICIFIHVYYYYYDCLLCQFCTYRCEVETALLCFFFSVVDIKTMFTLYIEKKERTTRTLIL